MPKISLSKLLPKLKTVAPQSNLPKFRITPVSGVVTGVVLDQYMVDQAQVIIAKEGGRGKFDCDATVFSFGNSFDSDILGLPD